MDKLFLSISWPCKSTQKNAMFFGTTHFFLRLFADKNKSVIVMTKPLFFISLLYPSIGQNKVLQIITSVFFKHLQSLRA